MSFLKNLFKGKRYRQNLEKARSLDGMAVKYITEFVDGNENVISRGGGLSVMGDNLIVLGERDRLFISDLGKVEICELMSGDGVVITGPNLIYNDEIRMITVHFVYYRK